MFWKKWILFVIAATLALTAITSVAADTAPEDYGVHVTFYGDLTLNGVIGADDALEVLLLVVGKSTADHLIPAADVDQDGQVSAADALEILKYIVGKDAKIEADQTVTVHRWSDWQTVRPATEQQDGLEQRRCLYCVAIEEKSVAYVPPESAETLMQKEVLALVNAERAKEGLSPLAYYALGQQAGDIRAGELNTLFSHDRPDGSSCFTVIENDVDWYTLGENIAMGQRTPAEVMTAWMNSEGHRKNIMNPEFTHLIVGVTPCVKEGYVGYCWVQLFIGM